VGFKLGSTVPGAVRPDWAQTGVHNALMADTAAQMIRRGINDERLII
jgi:hypothetical protein